MTITSRRSTRSAIAFVASTISPSDNIRSSLIATPTNRTHHPGPARVIAPALIHRHTHRWPAPRTHGAATPLSPNDYLVRPRKTRALADWNDPTGVNTATQSLILFVPGPRPM